MSGLSKESSIFLKFSTHLIASSPSISPKHRRNARGKYNAIAKVVCDKGASEELTLLHHLIDRAKNVDDAYTGRKSEHGTESERKKNHQVKDEPLLNHGRLSIADWSSALSSFPFLFESK